MFNSRTSSNTSSFPTGSRPEGRTIGWRGKRGGGGRGRGNNRIKIKTSDDRVRTVDVNSESRNCPLGRLSRPTGHSLAANSHFLYNLPVHRSPSPQAGDKQSTFYSRNVKTAAVCRPWNINSGGGGGSNEWKKKKNNEIVISSDNFVLLQRVKRNLVFICRAKSDLPTVS